jgi:hypothetical protein
MSNTITLEELCDIFSTNPVITLINAHGGISDNMPLYTDLPTKFTLIEVGVVTHSTWKTYIPEVIQFLKKLCKLCTSGWQNISFSKDDIFILSLMRIYIGGTDMQAYNMTFSGEHDPESYIRKYNGCADFWGRPHDLADAGMDGDLLHVDTTNNDSGPLVTYLDTFNAEASYLNIKRYLQEKFGDSRHLAINIVCKPSVPQMTRSTTAYIKGIIGSKTIPDIDVFMITFNMLLQIQHMRNAKYLEIFERLSDVRLNRNSLFLARHEFMPENVESVFDAAMIIENGARAHRNGGRELQDRIRNLLSQYTNNKNPADKLKILEKINNQLDTIIYQKRYLTKIKLALPVEEEDLVSKFEETILKVQASYTHGVSDVHDILSDMKNSVDLIFRQLRYGTQFKDVWDEFNLPDSDFEDTVKSLLEIYDDRKKGADMNERVKRNTESFISHLSDFSAYYPCHNPNGNLYKVLKDFSDELQLCLCRFCKCDSENSCGPRCVGTVACGMATMRKNKKLKHKKRRKSSRKKKSKRKRKRKSKRTNKRSRCRKCR